jgi:hypothetical protein
MGVVPLLPFATSNDIQFRLKDIQIQPVWRWSTSKGHLEIFQCDAGVGSVFMKNWGWYNSMIAFLTLGLPGCNIIIEKFFLE